MCILCGIYLCASPPAIPMRRCPNSLGSNGSTSFSLGNPRCAGQLPCLLSQEISNPLEGEVPRVLSPGRLDTLDQMHTPSARTQDNDEIWRYLYLWILAPGIEPRIATIPSLRLFLTKNSQSNLG